MFEFFNFNAQGITQKQISRKCLFRNPGEKFIGLSEMWLTGNDSSKLWKNLTDNRLLFWKHRNKKGKWKYCHIFIKDSSNKTPELIVFN